MSTTNSKLMLGAALCALLLSGCSSDGLSVGASNGAGFSGSSQGAPADGSGSGGASTTAGGDTGTATTASTDTGSGGSGGTGAGTSSGMLGNGTVTVTSGGTTATTPGILPGAVSQRVGQRGSSLLTTGNALLPTSTATGTLQPATAGLPASANAANTSLGGSPTQPVGVSVLSNSQTPGSAATVGVASAGQTGTVTVNPAGTAAGGVLNGTSAIANVTAGKNDVVTGSNPLIGATAATPAQGQGSVANVGVLSNGQPVSANAATQPPVNLSSSGPGRIQRVGPSPQGH